MSLNENEIPAWAKEHKASFEIAPMIEMHDGQKVQVGYEVNLFVQLIPGPNAQQSVGNLWEALRDIAQKLLPPEATKARLEVAPYRPAARLRPENEMTPEVMLSARIFHAADYFASVTEQERAALSGLEKRLTALGLKQGHW